ncbi:MAG: TonB-dependent receptor, partial [bacterium]
MYKLKIFLAVLILSFSYFVHAQNGLIRGKVFDGATGEFLPGVTIFAEGTTSGSLTDLDGEFNLSLPAGTYKIRISFISYETILIEGVNVKEDEVTLLENIRLQETSFDLTEVVITAQQVQNTEAALMTIKKKSANVIDGISSAAFRKTGDSDAAASIKRVPGVSVQGGRYVYVRGLGDRYTKTIMNGVDIPGLDPDRNTLQMDIFPTGIIDNLIIFKSFSADLPADFTGGIIDINIKDFPEKRKANISLSAQYNPSMHFNSGFLKYNGGKTDWLGYDDGTRTIPATENIPFFSQVVVDPDGVKGQRYREILESFNPNLAAYASMNYMDFSVAADFGNQFNLNKVTVGYDVALSYKAETIFYPDAEFGRYGLSGNPDIYEMDRREYQVGDFATSSVIWTGLAGLAVKTKKSKFRLNLLHIQNGESQAAIFDYASSDQGSIFEGFQHNLGYSQRSLSNLYLSGKHNFPTSQWTIEWKLSPTMSRMYEPDIRFTRYVYRGDLLSIGTESGFPERIWRDLNEINLPGVVHVTKEFSWWEREAKVQFGGAYTYKERDFIIYNYNLNIRGIPLMGDPNELFWEENLWTYGGYPGGDPAKGTTIEAPFIAQDGSTNNPNEFVSNVSSQAAYAMIDFYPFRRFKAILGVRMEMYTQRYTGQNQLGTIVLDNDIVLDDLDFFPSVNLIYQLNEKMNLRGSYTMTIARPSFKELSYAEIYDPVSSRTFVGGLFQDSDPVAGQVYWDGNLVSTNIHNVDLRWEYFQDRGRMVSFSLFYKRFLNPIEIVQFATQTGSFQPRNVGDGTVYGSEIEFRQHFGFVSPTLTNLSIVANFSYIIS